MRSIHKGAEPQALLTWKAVNAITPNNLRYGGGGFPAEDVRKALLAEQFHLCAYTMKALKTAIELKGQNLDTRSACHIEHLLPQARKIPAETIDYKNMLACYPASQSRIACEYGAKIKDDYDPAIDPFVSPLSLNSERHFTFAEDGEVAGVSPEGMKTVEVLKLDHKILVNERAAAIRGWLEPKRGHPLTAAAARRLAVNVMQPDTHRCMEAYCVAISAAASAYAERLERRAARLKQKGLAP